ncbi:MAG: hypothetical protein OWR62_10480, partial [Sulfobacillus thermotolerans]|nr:hypothetical protein [Sulfobacillus thermotolerans]
VAVGRLVDGKNSDQDNDHGMIPIGLLGMRVWLLRLFEKSTDLLVMVVTNGATYLAQGAVAVLLPMLIVQKLHYDSLYSWVMTAGAVADLIAGMASTWVLARLPRKFRPMAYGILAALNGLTLLLIAVAHTPAIIVGAMFIGGLCLEILYVLYVVQVQRTIPENAMGRYETLSASYSSVLMGLGTILAGLWHRVIGGLLVVSFISVMIPLAAGALRTWNNGVRVND